MIRVIQQSDIFAYSQYEAECEPEAALNMMTGRNLMEVYYHSVPVFRCNMGHSIEDDVFFCRINFKGNTAFIYIFTERKRMKPEQMISTKKRISPFLINIQPTTACHQNLGVVLVDINNPF